MGERVAFEPKRGERVPFAPERTCDCPMLRIGYAGVIRHLPSCEQEGTEWLAQSGDSIIAGKSYRWIHDEEEFNLVAEVTRVDSQLGMVYAYWHKDHDGSDQRDRETCIPNSAVVELVES